MRTEKRQCNKCAQEFTLDDNDFSFYEKMKVCVPMVCPDCRFKMRAVWRNEMSLYSGRKCHMCGEGVITIYNPKSPYTIYCYQCYRSDKWDATDYALDYDVSRLFFDQLKELLLKVPKVQMINTVAIGVNINSDFTNVAGALKNCYMLFNAGPAEDSMYSRGVKDCIEVCDVYFGTKLDQCYNSVNVQQSSQITNSKNVIGCVDSHFMLNCSGCTSCFGCVNLRNKSYHWYNEQLSKEEYNTRLKEILGSYSQYEFHKNKFKKHSLSFPVRENNNIKNINSTGDYLFETKDVKNSFEVVGGENCKYIFSSKSIKDSIGTIGYGYRGEMLLECVGTGSSSKIIGSFKLDDCRDAAYCFDCMSNNIIGCDGLRKKEYCILNKQYTKEEYEKLKNHIVKELTDKGIHGLMMPPELAPFAYNECIAQDNLPLTKEDALKFGFRWEDDIQITRSKETLLPEQIEDNITEIKDNIIKEVLRCISCQRNYRIIEQELLFYKKMKLPIPRQCFYCRHQDRILRRGPYKFWDRKCAHCNKDIKTNYSPDSPEIVYCEQCYQQEII